MRLLTGIIMFIFVFFLSTPTIVGLIEKNSDTTIFYGMSEEEIAHKQIKTDFIVEHSVEILKISTANKGAIICPQSLLHDNVASTVVIPPPEQV